MKKRLRKKVRGRILQKRLDTLNTRIASGVDTADGVLSEAYSKSAEVSMDERAFLDTPVEVCIRSFIPKKHKL